MSSLAISATAVSSINYKNGDEDEQCERKSVFTRLPLEILATFFSYLNKDGKKACRLVCWEWKEVLEEYLLKFHGVLNDSTYEFIRTSNLHFTTLTVSAFNRTRQQDFNNDNEGQGYSMSMSRNKLALSPDNLIFAYGSLGHSSACTVSEHNMAMLLSLNRNVKSLRFRLNSLKNIKSLPIRGLYMQNLTKLEIAFTREIIYENQIFHQLTEIGMPSLNHLIFHVTKFIIFEREKSSMFYFSLFQFVAQHKTSLTSLEIRNDYYLFFSFLNNPRHGHHSLPVPNEVQEALHADLAQVQLTEFSFLFKKPECNAPYTLGFNLMETQTRLEKLKIEERNDSHILHAGILRTIHRNCETLVHFTWRSCRYTDKLYYELTTEMILQLSCCTRLQSLCLLGFRIQSFSGFIQGPFPTMKCLEIEGDLNPKVLLEITTSFPQLEKLRFYHLTPLIKDRYRELASNLRAAMTMSNLKIINWYVHGLFLHYAARLPDISVKRGKQGRHYYIITLNK